MTLPGHLDFYTVVLFLHVVAAILAFGATFAFPIIDMTVRRVDLRSLPVWHETQIQINRKLITPGATLVLVTGIYIASDRWDKVGSFWFTAAGVIVVVLLGLSHGLLIPTARRLRDQAREDLADGAHDRGQMSTAYRALERRMRGGGGLMLLLVLVALLLMTWKPGA